MIRLSKAVLVGATTLATSGYALAQTPPTGAQPTRPPAGPPAPPAGTQPAPPAPPAPPQPNPPPGTDTTPPPDGEQPPPGTEVEPPPTATPELPPIPEAPPPPAPKTPSLTLAPGKALIAGSTFVHNSSSGAVGQPVSLAPSLWYGVDDRLTIGLTHDGGTTPWTPRPRIRTITTFDGIRNPLVETGGPGICISGDDNGCSGIYDNAGIDGLYALLQAPLALAAHAALEAGSFDPFLLQLRIGALGLYAVNDRLSIAFDPRLRFGLTERDSNKERIDLPVWIWYAAHERVGVYLHTGIEGEITSFGDTYAIPLQVGGSYRLTAPLTLGLDLAFTRVNDGLDARVFGLRAAYAL